MLLITTSSALGRSSVYNRLKLECHNYFKSIGYTSGWGHFHIPEDLFGLMRKYLEAKNHKYANNHSFGHGPSWKIRVARETLSQLGMNENLLRHGIKREVFICELASNAVKVLLGKAKRAQYKGLKRIQEVAELCKDRWIIPRAERVSDYKIWKKENILKLLCSERSFDDLSRIMKVGRNKKLELL